VNFEIPENWRYSILVSSTVQEMKGKESGPGILFEPAALLTIL